MVFESMPPIEYKPHIQFFKTEDIVILVVICVVSLLLTILWLLALIHYLRSKGISPASLNNKTTNLSKTHADQSIDYQSADVDSRGNQDRTSLELAKRNGRRIQ